MKVGYSSKITNTVMQTYMYLLHSRLHMAQDKFCHSLVYIVNVKKCNKKIKYTCTPTPPVRSPI